eukprot:scaffold49335_cov36-Phaeocystis_antarctica.AAC.1
MGPRSRSVGAGGTAAQGKASPSPAPTPSPPRGRQARAFVAEDRTKPDLFGFVGPSAGAQPGQPIRPNGGGDDGSLFGFVGSSAGAHARSKSGGG